MKVTLQKFNRFFDRFFLVNFIILSMGIPLLFTSLTRSVFEVNKLLVLRLVILIVYGAWMIKSLLLKENNLDPEDKDCYIIFGYKFRRIGLEIPMLAWILANLLSIFFSESIIIALVGSYDRWEGLATTLNYLMLFYMVAKLINSTAYRLIIYLLLLFSTCISSIYGIVQSLGLDFMNWSTSPVNRVFACINNPVHFCAYVAMIVPIGVSLSHYFLDRFEDKQSNKHNRYVAPILSTILGILFYNLLFMGEFVAYLQYILLSVIGAYVLRLYKDIIPSKTALSALLAYIAGVFLLTYFSLLSISPIQVVALVFTLIVYFCASAYSNKQLLLYRLSTCCVLIVFYSMFLSYSRATLIGFSVSMALFYQLFFLEKTSNKLQIYSVISLFFANLILIFSCIFKLHQYAFIIDAATLVLSYLLLHYSSKTSLKKSAQLAIHAPIYIALLVIFKSTNMLTACSSLLVLVLYMYYFKAKLNRTFIYNSFILFIFMGLCFFATQFSYIGFTLLLILLLKEYYFKQESENKNFFQISLTLFSFLFIVAFSVYPVLFNKLSEQFAILYQYPALLMLLLFLLSTALILFQLYPSQKKLTIAATVLITSCLLTGSFFYGANTYQTESSVTKRSTSDNIEVRMGSLAQDTSSNARLYMWKSLPPWLLDYPIFGSGPDTIRLLYPVYRHPKYGDAEGGHNFTPDRLHNEYINTLATLGILGFIVKYVFLFGIWYLILIKLFNKHIGSSKKLIIMGAICAPTIYSVQVIFNFGVVATLFLFYFLMGLGLSFVNDEYTKE